MITSLSLSCTAEELQLDGVSACCALSINIHKRATDIAMASKHAQIHLSTSTDVFVFCINELLAMCFFQLLKNSKMEPGYVLANRLLIFFPAALPFLASPESSIYVALWNVAKESWHHALKLCETTSSVKNSTSSDSCGILFHF
ncbi:unnamed protein product [Gongylonema pulchrum]|uniref:Secreted protein n=1 Tax=Gongylonema pulchrum TaxID=637853 RepID=A0A183DXP7_9BILA|nr:unnamed protein product [Gongylonema pulchrum]